MVANKGGEDTPIGIWLDAEEGEFAGLSKTGRPQVKSTGSGNLSYRPGWHLGDVPRAPQFDRRNKETGEMEFPKDFVWAECDYAMDVDYQSESDARGYERTKVDDQGNVITTKSKKFQHSLAGLPKLPTNGYYKYRTNPRPDTVPWVITGQMKVNRLLDDFEVNEILKSKGIEPIHRQGGDKTLKELGLTESLEEKCCNEDIEKHDTLNPKLWDENNQLKPEVHEKILQIVDEFKSMLAEDGIKIDIKDIILVGSNASYNYTKDSDLDIHIKVDLDNLECPSDLYPLLYSAYRSIFNKNLDIDFYGIPVEIFVETV
jgi:predicted nucleotidyltransferase